MKQILFFATEGDLRDLLELADSIGPLKYTRMGNFPNHEIQNCLGVFDTGTEIPNLGKAGADSATACDSYIVCERDSPINLRHLQGINGERVCIDQLANPDSIEFTPGGIWNNEIVLHGRIATASESQISQALMKRFQIAIKRNFSKVKAYYVGPNALVLLESGKRLTSSAQSPREFDLAPA